MLPHLSRRHDGRRRRRRGCRWTLLIPQVESRLSIVMSTCLLLSRLYLLVSTFTQNQVNAEAQREPQQARDQQQQQQQQQHNQAKEQLHLERQNLHPLLVERRYWLGNTEFGERDNWRDRMKPCTLLERINIIEQSVISMGDSMDEIGNLLESNIRDLALPSDGVLLLEEDSPVDSIDPMFIKYLNESGDCLELSDHATADHLFEFSLDDDQKSWFNPDNWASSLDESGAVDYSPESHKIPCGEDVAIFGDRKYDLTTTTESGEREKSLSFTVNFKPSAFIDTQDGSPPAPNLTSSNLRVSKLVIAGQSYNQEEFLRLIGSESYRDLLFQFQGSSDQSTWPASNSLLTIDESSIHADIEPEVCLDEAGCLCGNEEANIMKVVCSFHEPLEPEDHACHDPIESPGYCNKICATSLTIVMDPTKFSERYLINQMNRLLEQEPEADSVDNIFTGARRTHANRYEITFMNTPDRQGYWRSLGWERKLAELLRDSLEKDAIKSYYGIKSTAIKSSVSWRKGNRDTLFWFTLVLTLPLAALIYAQNEELMQKIELRQYLMSLLIARFASATQHHGGHQQTGASFSLDEGESFVRFSEPRIATEDSDSINQEIQLLELDTKDSDSSQERTQEQL